MANALSWLTLLGALLALGALTLAMGCVSVSIKRPETAQALYFSNDIVRSAAYGVAFAAVIDDLKDIKRPTDSKAQEWAKRGDFLLTCGEILTATAEPLSEDRLQELRQVILAVQYSYSGQDWKSVLRMGPWWAVFSQMDGRDRAQLSSFCIYAADGVQAAWAETKSKKGW